MKSIVAKDVASAGGTVVLPPAKVQKFTLLTQVASLAGQTFDKAADVDPDKPLRFIASDESVDRYGDIVRQAGWDLAAFKRNPVALFGHSHRDIVGAFSRVWVDGKQLLADLMLAEQGTGPIVDYVRALVRQRLLKAVSVSFLPLEWRFIRDEKEDRITGYEFLKQELLEISLVSVPANAQALEIARSLHLSDDMQRSLLAPATRGLSAQRARVELEKLRA